MYCSTVPRSVVHNVCWLVWFFRLLQLCFADSSCTCTYSTYINPGVARAVFLHSILNLTPNTPCSRRSVRSFVRNSSQVVLRTHCSNCSQICLCWRAFPAHSLRSRSWLGGGKRNMWTLAGRHWQQEGGMVSKISSSSAWREREKNDSFFHAHAYSYTSTGCKVLELSGSLASSSRLQQQQQATAAAVVVVVIATVETG